jgi:salicylate hydroxylase
LKIGAGIQIPPNSSRILHSWGLKTALERRSIKPRSLVWRRWSDGVEISLSRLNPESEKRFGSPYYVTHRAHLHEALHERTQDLDIPVILNRKAESYDVENGTVTFMGGEIVRADLVVAADGTMLEHLIFLDS